MPFRQPTIRTRAAGAMWNLDFEGWNSGGRARGFGQGFIDQARAGREGRSERRRSQGLDNR
jgi:hypothetical protein